MECLNRRAAVWIAGWLLVGGSCVSGQTQASKTIFTVDPGVLSPGLNCRTIYLQGGEPLGGGAASGIAVGECMDGFSLNKTTQKFLLCFSVDRESTGDPFKGPLLPEFKYNVTEQSEKRQAAGDAFVSTEAYDRDTGKEPVPISMGEENNVLVINQSPLFTSDFGIMPTIDPDFPYRLGDPLPDVAADLDDVDGGGTLPGGLLNPIYFTKRLEVGSDVIWYDPTPNLRGPSPADDDPSGDETVFTTAAALGLLPGDDIDALGVFDGDMNGVFSMGDQVIFSPARGSTSIGTRGPGISPGDMLSVKFGDDGPGALTVFATHGDSGLLFGDDIQMFEPVGLRGTALETIRRKLCGDLQLRLVLADGQGGGQPFDVLRLDGTDLFVEMYVQALITGDGLAQGLTGFGGDLFGDETGNFFPAPLTAFEALGFPVPGPDPNNRAGMFPTYRDAIGNDNSNPDNGQQLPGVYQFVPQSFLPEGNGEAIEGVWANVYKVAWATTDGIPRRVEIVLDVAGGNALYVSRDSGTKLADGVNGAQVSLLINTCPCERSGDPHVVDVLDLLSFVSKWFEQEGTNVLPGTGADYNGSGQVDILDLLDYLSCWFAVTAPNGNCGDG